jgi:hypothetical protein
LSHEKEIHMTSRYSQYFVLFVPTGETILFGELPFKVDVGPVLVGPDGRRYDIGGDETSLPIPDVVVRLGGSARAGTVAVAIGAPRGLAIIARRPECERMTPPANAAICLVGPEDVL